MIVYLDNHSSTQCDKRVIDAIEPYFYNNYGNPASPHLMGDNAKEAVEKSKIQIASLINANQNNIYFTPSASIANNIILKGRTSFVDRMGPNVVQSIIMSNTEHSSITKCLQQIDYNRKISGKQEVSRGPIRIDQHGELNYNALETLLKNFNHFPILVSIIAANNEIGTIHDLYRIGELCHKYNALFHTDATQAIGKVEIDVDKMNIFALSMSGHKIYAPKGIGALYIRDKYMVDPLVDGGYQDTFLSGTQNVPGIVALGKACEILNQEGKEENERIKKLRDKLWVDLSSRVPDIFINGTMKNRLPNNLNVAIKGVKAEVLIKGMDDVIVSGGSACMSGIIEPSHVITALGSQYPDCAIRFGLGRFTTEDEINYAVDRIVQVIESVRSNDAKEDRY